MISRIFARAAAIVLLSLLNSPAKADDLFYQGLQDRTGWETWFSSLSGDERAGAEYWAGQRSLPLPGNCIGTADFQRGSDEAKRRLAGPDTLRKSHPEYKAGWNSYREVSPLVPAALNPADRFHQQQVVAQIAEAANAQRAAVVERDELAAREARALVEKARADLDQRKARQEAEDARAEAQLRYESLVAGQVTKEKERGYTPITFDDYVLDKKDLSIEKTKIAIHGFYKHYGHVNLLLRAASSEATNEDDRLILLTDGAERDARKFFLICRDNAAICSVTVLGSVVQCASTDEYGAKTETFCLTVEDEWNVPEPSDGNS